jgi:diguanylate cyclase (GGDEF)-like protein
VVVDGQSKARKGPANRGVSWRRQLSIVPQVFTVFWLAMSRPRVLIIEDEPLQREIICAALAGQYDVTTADTGAAGLAQAPFADLVLLDAGLPDMDGVEVCRTLKAEKDLADIPVVFLTARSQADDHVQGLAAGAVDYVTKPVNIEILRAKVKTYISLKSQRDALTKLATLDGLTGIPNRRSFDATLAREWRRLSRATASLSVVLLDVDHFKQYNDTYGHGPGDECLKAVARALSSAIHRPADLVARYGGEEFVVLLPETTLEGALQAAETVRTSVAALNIAHAGSSAAKHVTVSLGVASVIPHDGVDATQLLAAADEQLYAAKKAGRNCARGAGVILGSGKT